MMKNQEKIKLSSVNLVQELKVLVDPDPKKDSNNLPVKTKIEGILPDDRRKTAVTDTVKN